MQLNWRDERPTDVGGNQQYECGRTVSLDQEEQNGQY